MPKSDLRIDILGTELTISTDEEKEYLENLLEKYRQTIENVRQRTGLKDPLKTAVLTGFLLCDDLEKAGSLKGSDRGETREETKNEDQGEAETLTLRMISRLEEILVTPSELPIIGTDNNLSVPMQSIFKLQNTVKNYKWGSAEWIPALLGEKNFSRVPWAELWMGVNPAGPSRLKPLDGTAGKTISKEPHASALSELPKLSDLIEGDKNAFLGEEIANEYGTLPFLFKVIAAARPLSIQAHPSLEQAREGFMRENEAGIPLDSPERNYKNPNHKPEIICALNSFAALCGFRKTEEIGFLFEILSQESEGQLKAGFEKLNHAISALKEQEETSNPYSAFISALFNMEAEVLKEMALFFKTQKAVLERDFPEYGDEWNLCSYFSGLSEVNPGDPGILAPLYLNIIELAPGQAMCLPAGVLHAYIQGMGIELMADSDNVLRGGLTSKHINVDELKKILAYREYKPEILRAPDPSIPLYSFPSPSIEFALSVINGAAGEVSYAEAGPSILIITSGGADITVMGEEENQEVYLETGESVFIPPQKNLTFKGNFTAYAATAGKRL